MRTRYILPVALLLAAGAAGAAKPIERSEALERAERYLAQAEKEGAQAAVPQLWLAAIGRLNDAHEAYRIQVKEKADDSDDEEYIAAQRLAEQAEVDAELALESARAIAEENRLTAVQAGVTAPRRGVRP